MLDMGPGAVAAPLAIVRDTIKDYLTRATRSGMEQGGDGESGAAPALSEVGAQVEAGSPTEAHISLSLEVLDLPYLT